MTGRRLLRLAAVLLCVACDVGTPDRDAGSSGMDSGIADANVTVDSAPPDSGPPMCREIGEACTVRSDCCFGLVCGAGQCLCFRAGDTSPCGSTLPDGSFVHAYCCSRHSMPVPGNESNCACSLSGLGDRCMSDADCEVGTCVDNVCTAGP